MLKKYILSLLLLASFFVEAQKTSLYNVDLPDDSITHYLLRYDTAISESNAPKMNLIRNRLDARTRIYSENQKAIKLFFDAYYYSYVDLYDNASKKLFKTAKLAKQNNLRQLELYARNGLAVLEYSLNNMNTAIEGSLEVLKDCDANKDWHLIGRIHGNLAALTFEKATWHANDKQFQDSLIRESDQHYLNAISILEEHNDYKELARVYAIYARSLIRDHEFEKAKRYLIMADTACILSNNSYRYFFNQIKWSEFYKEKKEYDKAREYLYKALPFFKKVGNMELEHSVQLEMAVNYAYVNQFDSAYYYAIMLERLRKHMSIEKMGRQSQLYKVELDVFDKENKIQEQNQQIEFQKYQNELAEAKTKRWIIGGISAVAILILIAILIIQNLRQKAKTEQANIIIKERETAFRAVISGQEKERKRIAQELHDGIGQQLSGIKMALQNIVDSLKSQSENVNKDLQNVVDLVSSSASDVRLLAHQMLPQVLIEKGLEAALKDLIQVTHHSTGIKFDFDYQSGDLKLNEDYELSIYRSIQEMVNNTIKHAEASKIYLYIYKSGSNILIAYSDNGKGLDEKFEFSGLGLSGIKNRIENLNGNFSIDKSSDSGFSAIFKLPLI